MDNTSLPKNSTSRSQDGHIEEDDDYLLDDDLRDDDLRDDAAKERAYHKYHDLMNWLDARDRAGPHYWAR